MNCTWLVISILASVNAIGQHATVSDDVETTLLNVGTPSSPIKLTKRWFEEETIYTITFRNGKSDTKGKCSSQGFFKSGLNEFGRALSAALTIDSTQQVRFGKANIIIRKRVSGKCYVECTFSSSTGTLLARDEDVQKLVYVIQKQ